MAWLDESLSAVPERDPYVCNKSTQVQSEMHTLTNLYAHTHANADNGVKQESRAARVQEGGWRVGTCYY